ncbi:hypothetical protein LXL04_008008 [Taraxacum kok-saghyz]
MSALRKVFVEVTENSKTFRNTIDDLHCRHEKHIATLKDDITEKDKQIMVINQVVVRTMAAIHDLSDVFNFFGLQNNFEKSLSSACGTNLKKYSPSWPHLRNHWDLQPWIPQSQPETAPEISWEHIVPKSMTVASSESISLSEAIQNASSRDHRWIKKFELLGLDLDEDVPKKKPSIGDSGENVSSLRLSVLNNLKDQGRPPTYQELYPVSRGNPHAKIKNFHLVPMKMYEVSADRNVQLYLLLSPFANYYMRFPPVWITLPLDNMLDWNLSSKNLLNQSRRFGPSHASRVFPSSGSDPLQGRTRRLNSTCSIFGEQITRVSLCPRPTSLMNPTDILILSRHLDTLRAKNLQMGPPYLALSAFLKDYLCEFGRLDYDLYTLYKDTLAPYAQSTTQKRRYFKVYDKHFYPSNSHSKVITKPQMAPPGGCQRH